jgi:hypothetical protein
METKSMLIELFIKHVLPIALTGLVGVIVWAVKALAAKLTAEGKATKLQNAESRLALFAAAAVADVEATLRPLVAKASEDGKLTPEEAAELKKAAMDRVKAMLADKGAAEVQAILGIFAPQLEVIISGFIERAVGRLPPSVPDAPVAVAAAAVVPRPSTPPAR